MTKILVIAKAPVPGRVKTRLCPPCTPFEAAAIAEAALRDTLDAVTSVEGAEPVVVLDGEPGPWLADDVLVIPQRGKGLAERLSAAFADAGGPSLLIGMDTPHVTTQLLSSALDALLEPGVDAVLGHAHDGGWWATGLCRSHAGAFVGVPMSTRRTGAVQLLRFRQLGMTVAELPRLGDVDTFDDAIAIADIAPETRFATAVSLIAERIDRSRTAVEMTG